MHKQIHCFYLMYTTLKYNFLRHLFVVQVANGICYLIKFKDENSHTNAKLVLRGWNHRASRSSVSKN